MENSAMIAMSGGVDSSVAAFLMKDRGYDCIGVTMKLLNNEDVLMPKEHSCCSLDDVEDARSVANLLDMPYYVFNFSERFNEEVIQRFIKAYENGMTPNPCIDCNKHLKFDKLFLRAKELGYYYVVTGHYARIEKDEVTGRYILRKSLNKEKDQSYVLYSMTQEQLKHTLFPLGEMEKTRVREIAQEQGFINAKKHDSQDICFVQNGNYADFIEKHTKRTYPEGNFVDMDGNVLGKHKGIIRYTIGQRKGLGLSLKEPMYVVSLDLKNNNVILGRNQDLFSKELVAEDINLISVEKIDKEMRVKAKVRYRQPEQPATVIQTDDNHLKIVFDEPQRAITKGQAVVLYDGDTVVGGGTISGI